MPIIRRSPVQQLYLTYWSSKLLSFRLAFQVVYCEPSFAVHVQAEFVKVLV